MVKQIRPIYRMSLEDIPINRREDSPSVQKPVFSYFNCKLKI